MNLNFGINGSIGSEASVPITVSSSTPIGLLATAADKTLLHGLSLHNNADDAMTYCTENSVAGDVIAALKGIRLQGVNCPVVLNLCDTGDELEACELFKKSEGLVGLSLKNGLLLAPVLSSSNELGLKLDAIAKVIWATAIIDNFSDDEAGVMAYAANYSTRYSLLTHGRYQADGELIPCSALYAGLIAYWDAYGSYGWAKSHSNRVASGVSGSERVLEYLEGSDCEARRMRQAGVASILCDTGWRSYGFETTDIDGIWQSLDRTRTFHRLLATIMESSKWARDREANELLTVQQSIVDFMNELKGNDVVIGFDVYFDTAKNTKATVTAGKFYLTILVSDMPSVRELNIELVYSDNWNDVLINYINGAE